MHTRTIAALAALAIALPAGAAQAGAVLDRITQNGKLVMSTDAEYPPQSSLDENNQFVGFDIDVGTEIAKRLGVEIEFVTPGWETIVSGKWAGRWDVLGRVDDADQGAHRGARFPGDLLFHAGRARRARRQHHDQHAGRRLGQAIGVGAATTYEQYLQGSLTIDAEGAPTFDYQIEDAQIQPYETDVPALDDLRLGDGTRLDAAMTALPTIQGAIAGGYPIKAVGDPLFYEPLRGRDREGRPGAERQARRDHRRDARRRHAHQALREVVRRRPDHPAGVTVAA